MSSEGVQIDIDFDECDCEYSLTAPRCVRVNQRGNPSIQQYRIYHAHTE